MADRELSSIVQIDGDNYKVVAAKVANKLTITKLGDGTEDDPDEVYQFDGDEAVEITLAAAESAGRAIYADKIQVNMVDTNQKEYATISISSTEPPVSEDYKVGDIWFKVLD